MCYQQYRYKIYLQTRISPHLFQPHININPNSYVCIQTTWMYNTKTHVGLKRSLSTWNISARAGKTFFFSYLWLLDASQMDIIMPIINAAEQYSANIFNVYWRKNCIHNSNCKTTFSIQQRRWYVSPRNHTQLMLPHRHTTASYLVHCLIIKAIVCRDGMVAGCAIMMFLQICWRP